MFVSTLFIILPLVMAGVVHHFVIIPRDLFSYLARPLDGKRQFGDQPLLGATKTWRGVLVMVALPVVFGSVLLWVFQVDRQHFFIHPLAALGLVGLAYSLGELPTSFIKRRLGLSSSEQRHDALGVCLYILEQLDSVFAVALVLFLVTDPVSSPRWIILTGSLIGLAIKICLDFMLYTLGYKKTTSRPWLMSTKTSR